MGDFRASSLGTLVQMVVHGVGVTLLPSIAVDIEGERNPSLVSLPFTRPLPHRTICLAWRPMTARRTEFRLLADVIREVV
jgi:LysR family hydrogen peroxide-inducible transcriptional activator